ncbi:MAG: hypothetical protein R3E79_24165 [Caldilineaceae bacterium]
MVQQPSTTSRADQYLTNVTKPTIQGNQTNIAGDVKTDGGMVNTGTTHHSQDRPG